MTASSKPVHDEALFRLIVQASPAGLLLVDEHGEIVLANQKALQYFGFEEPQLLGQAVETLIPAAHHAAHAEHMARYMSQPRSRSMAAGRDLFARRRDGSEFPVDISLHPLATDQGTYFLTYILDATERRRAQRDAERRHSLEQLALLGQLAGGVAHEIRTPLCVIRNDVYFLQTLADRLGPDGIECIEEINQAVGKASRIVSELLDFTREPPTHPLPVLLEDILAESLSDYPIPSGVAWERPVAAQLQALAVHADREQIARVLTNLFRNAVQAMHGTGKLQLLVEHDSQQVRLIVCDSGPGVAASDRNSVFEPLFTTKPNGIGLGLAVSQRYAHRNHGQLELLDSDGSGACFQLTLPMATALSTR